MGQKLTKAPRGGYDAIVYIEGSEVVAEDSNGRKICPPGVAGTDDASVGQAAINYVGALSPNGVVLFSANRFTLETSLIPGGAFISIRGSGMWNTVLEASGDFPIFDLTDAQYVSISDMELWQSSGQTAPIVKIRGNTAFARNVTVSRCFFYNSYAAAGRTANGVEISSKDTSGQNLFNTIDQCFFYDLNSAVYLNCETTGVTGGVINGNTVKEIVFERCIAGIEFGSDGYTSSGTYGYSHNTFENVYGQALPGVSLYGVKNRKGAGNTFKSVIPWDFVDASSYYCTVDAGKEKEATIIGGMLHFNNAFTVSGWSNGGNKDFNYPLSKNVVTVAAKYADYSTLTAAFAAISPTVDEPYTILVFGDIDETAQITAKSYTNVFGFNAIINSALASGSNSSIRLASISNATWKNITVKRTGAAIDIGYVLSVAITDSTVKCIDCDFLNEITTGTYDVGAIINSSSMEFHACKFVGGGNAISGRGVQIDQGSAIPRFINCSAVGNAYGSPAWLIGNGGSPYMSNCSGRAGRGNNSICFAILQSSSPQLFGCRAELDRSYYSWAYNSANNGRFSPATTYPYQVLGIEINVTVATPGTTLNIGTSVDGAEVAAGVDLSATGLKVLSVTRSQLAAGSYLYATPVGGAPANSSFTCVLLYCYNYTGCNALNINTSGYARIVDCDFISNGASDCCTITPTYKNFKVFNSVLETIGSGNAILSTAPTTGETFRECHLVGTLSNINGIDNKSSGSSTGIGSEDAIPHGLAAIPVGCKAWITYLVGTRYVTEMIPFDATNVYPTVDNGVAYQWRIE